MSIIENQSEALDQLYHDLIIELKSKIEAQFGSVASFCSHCENIGLKKPSAINLSRVWNGKRDLGIGLYLRILIGLDIADDSLIIGDTLDVDLSLKTYMKINHDILNKSIHFINY